MPAGSSGTSGRRGLFVVDERDLAVIGGLGSRATLGLSAREVLRLLASGGRTAVVTAVGGHFWGAASTARILREHPLFRRVMRVFPTSLPLPELVEQLERYRPASVAGFLGVLTTLAGEQEAGRLRISPVVVLPGGETATAGALDRIASAFHAKVRPAYMATECTFLAFGCGHGWYHLNSDWAVVEPVDAEHRPVPPGEWSHTVLVSNLANRVQPILRYDLGDSMLVRPDPCPCGSPFPAMRVRGRASDVLFFPDGRGGSVGIPSIRFGTLLDAMPGIDQFQIVQTAPDTLRVRLHPRDGADAEAVWQGVRGELERLLSEHQVRGVALERTAEPLRRTSSGKVRRIVPLAGNGQVSL